MTDQIAWLSAIEEIRAALYRYCAAIDRGQYQWMDQVFHADAVLQIGPYEGAPAAFVDMLRSRHDSVSRAVHSLGNITIERVDEAHAFTESYCLAVEQMAGPEGDFDRTVRLRYADVFELRGGAWKIARRVAVVDHAMAPVPSATAQQFRGPQAARDDSDPAIQLRRSLGL